MERFKPVTTCRICGSGSLIKYLDFGNVPLANQLLSSIDSPVETYPIEVLVCPKCYLSQLSAVVSSKILFKDYVYHSSISNTFWEHCHSLVTHLKNSFLIRDTDLIVDIASNDGCLIKRFKENGFSNLLGVEPSENLTKDYHKFNIGVLNNFFSYENAVIWKKVVNNEEAKIVTAQNILAHVDDIKDFLLGVHHILSSDGIFVVEVPHAINILNQNQVDTIYHEHLSYFLLKPLISLFNSCSIPIFHVEEVPIHGGSLRIYASKNYYRKSSSISNVLEKESLMGCYDVINYELFGIGIKKLFSNLKDILIKINKSGGKIMGYGASAKGISLLNYSNIGNNLIHSIVDETPAKQNKWTPGSTIPIVPFKSFDVEKPDYILLLSWNFAQEMIDKTSYLSSNYIIPIPEVKIV